MRSIEGRVALVTGASRGIGRAIALELARAGTRVALNYRSGEADARAVAREIAALRAAAPVGAVAGAQHEARVPLSERAMGGRSQEAPKINGRPQKGKAVADARALDDYTMLIKADVGKGEEAREMVRKVVEHWGRLDILVNNAGITRDKTLRRLEDDDWLAVMETNLNSVFFTTQAAMPKMIEQGYGRIVNVSSVIGQSGNIGQANYSAAKGGIIAFTKSAALELAKYNVTVNAVAPGFTATEMVQAVPEKIQEQLKSKIPMGRFAEPEEIARAVLFLVADGDYITGQQLNVNGGIYM